MKQAKETPDVPLKMPCGARTASSVSALPLNSSHCMQASVQHACPPKKRAKLHKILEKSAPYLTFTDASQLVRQVGVRMKKIPLLMFSQWAATRSIPPGSYVVSGKVGGSLHCITIKVNRKGVVDLFDSCGPEGDPQNLVAIDSAHLLHIASLTSIVHIRQIF